MKILIHRKATHDSDGCSTDAALTRMGGCRSLSADFTIKNYDLYGRRKLFYTKNETKHHMAQYKKFLEMNTFTEKKKCINYKITFNGTNTCHKYEIDNDEMRIMKDYNNLLKYTVFLV